MPAHWPLCAQKQLAKYGTVVSADLLYFSSLTPCNVSLLLQMKDWMKSCHIMNAVEVQVGLKNGLQKVTPGDFQKSFKQLYEYWQMSGADEGEYFEGNSVKSLLVLSDLRYSSHSLKLPHKNFNERWNFLYLVSGFSHLICSYQKPVTNTEQMLRIFIASNE